MVKLVCVGFACAMSGAYFLGTTGCESQGGNSHANVSLAEYNEVTNRAHYAEVVAIFGDDPTKSSTSTGPGGVSAQVYEWINKDDSSATVSFENDAVYAKSQTNLK